MKSSGSCTIYIFCWNNSCPWHWTLASPSEWPQQLVWLPFLMCRLFKGSTVYQCLPRVAVFCVQNCYMLEAMSAGIGVDFAVQVGLIPQCRPWSHLIWAVCWCSGHDAVSPTCDEYRLSAGKCLQHPTTVPSWVWGFISQCLSCSCWALEAHHQEELHGAGDFSCGSVTCRPASASAYGGQWVRGRQVKACVPQRGIEGRGRSWP